MNDFKNYPVISVITLNWNEADDVVELLDSIKKLDYPKDKLEIIIADNGSAELSVEKIKNKYKKMKNDSFLSLKIIENKDNLGVTGALNNAFQNTSEKSKYILRMDNDIILAENSIRLSVEEMEKNDKIGVFGGQVFYYDKNDMSVPTEFGAIFYSLFKGKNILRQSENMIECSAIMGCYSMIRREAIKPPLYDDRFFVYSDDIDCCLRIKKSGYKIIYNPAVKVWHKVARNFEAKQAPKSFLYYSFRNRFLIENNHARLWHKLFFYPFYFFSTIRFFLLSVHGGKFYEFKIRLRAVKDAMLGKWGRQKI